MQNYRNLGNQRNKGDLKNFSQNCENRRLILCVDLFSLILYSLGGEISWKYYGHNNCRLPFKKHACEKQVCEKFW
jgi:hypothetical protein